jgi:hypothetical protein
VCHPLKDFPSNNEIHPFSFCCLTGVKGLVWVAGADVNKTAASRLPEINVCIKVIS